MEGQASSTYINAKQISEHVGVVVVVVFSLSLCHHLITFILKSEQRSCLKRYF